MEQLIVEARPNEYTPRQPNPNVPFSPFSPFSPAEIARDAAACRAAGAAIVHCPARDPQTGAPSAVLRLYAEAARRIRAACDVLAMPTDAEVVAEAVAMARRAGRAIAPPDEVRAHFMGEY